MAPSTFLSKRIHSVWTLKHDIHARTVGIESFASELPGDQMNIYCAIMVNTTHEKSHTKKLILFILSNWKRHVTLKNVTSKARYLLGSCEIWSAWGFQCNHQYLLRKIRFTDSSRAEKREKCQRDLYNSRVVRVNWQSVFFLRCLQSRHVMDVWRVDISIAGLGTILVCHLYKYASGRSPRVWQYTIVVVVGQAFSDVTTRTLDIGPSVRLFSKLPTDYVITKVIEWKTTKWLNASLTPNLVCSCEGSATERRITTKNNILLDATLSLNYLSTSR